MSDEYHSSVKSKAVLDLKEENMVYGVHIRFVMLGVISARSY